MSEEFRKLVDLLNSSPLEQCVIRLEFIEDLELDPQALSEATSRHYVRMTEIVKSSDFLGMAFRDSVYLFAPREDP